MVFERGTNLVDSRDAHDLLEDPVTQDLVLTRHHRQVLVAVGIEAEDDQHMARDGVP